MSALRNDRRTVAGGAGLAYVVGAAIENMEILEAPTLGSPVADVRALYDDQAFALVTTLAGAFALVAYALLAVSLFRLVRPDRWSRVGLVGGLGGPAVGAAALVASFTLIADAGLSDGAVEGRFDFFVQARILSGVFVALFMIGFGVAARRSGALPAWLAWLACALAIPFALAPLAAFSEDKPLEVAVRIAFSLQSLWIFATSLWLLFADGVGVVGFVRRAAFLVLVVAASLVGLAMVAVPGATGEFFSWELGPDALAAFAGGVYVGSAVLYAAGLRRGWTEVRGLVLGAVVLSVSVLIVTLTHLEPFDFDRLQAWAWLVLFAGFSLITTSVLLLGGREGGGDPGGTLAPRTRAGLALAGVLVGALALALWIDPTGLAGPSPFELSPLGGRFAGCWVALLAVLTGWAAVRNRTEEARLSALALVTLPAGALVAAVRTISDLEPAGAAAGYLAGIAVLLAGGLWLLASLGEAGPPSR